MVVNWLEQEEARLQDLVSYDILDTPEEQDFDDIVKLAAQICQCPIAMITFIDDRRQWFKAKVGLEILETSRELAFCTHTIQLDQLMIVEDTLEDERFISNPMVVQEPHIRFYAGVALQMPSGYKIGTLCVLDRQPKKLTHDQVFALEALSRYVVQVLELRRKNVSIRRMMRKYESLQKSTELQQNALTRAQNAARIGLYEMSVSSFVLKVSGGFCSLFGLENRHEIPLSELEEYIYPTDLANFQKYLKRVIRSGKRFAYEFRTIRKRGRREVYIRSTGEVIRDEEGSPLKIIGVMQNISDKKHYEKQLENQNAELLKVNQELDNFVYRVSHDLRAPISSMLGLIDIILHHESDIDKIRELMVMIRKSLIKHDKFIKDILDFSRNSRLSLQPEQIDFQEFIEDNFSKFVYAGQESPVTRSIQIEQEADFATDKSRLDIILSNLISNAIKYVNSNEENPHVKVHIQVNKEFAHISVEDNGIGIEEKHISRVFNMFYRATANKPGSGLGLYIVREAVNKLEGKVGIESKYGQGTRVMVQLPNLLDKLEA